MPRHLAKPPANPGFFVPAIPLSAGEPLTVRSWGHLSLMVSFRMSVSNGPIALATRCFSV